MGKLERRAELQHRFDGVLPWSVPRKVSIRISDYARQETILEWVVDNKDIYGKLPGSVWLKFLDNSEKTPDVPIEELLDTFKEDYPLLCEITKVTIDILVLRWRVTEFLVMDPSIQPSTGLGEYVKQYDAKEARLAELMKIRQTILRTREATLKV